MIPDVPAQQKDSVLDAPLGQGRTLPVWGNPFAVRENHFDLLRILFAVVVIYSHSYDLLGEKFGSDPLFKITKGYTSFGATSVNGFFAISGFLISASFLRCNGWRDYLRRRVRRLYPGLVGATLSTVAIAYLLGVVPRERFDLAHELPRLLGSMLVMGAYLPPGAFANNPYHDVFNGSLWTIRPEFICYLLIGLILTFRRGRSRLLVLLCLMAGLAAVHLVLRKMMPTRELRVSWPSPLSNVWLRLFSFFGAGVVAQFSAAMLPHRTAFAAVAAGCLAGAIFLLPPALPIVSPIAFTYLILWTAYLPGGHRTALMVRRVGDLSYGIYLYAFPVQQTLIHWYGNHLTPLRLFAAAVPPVIVCALASWWLVERPFLLRRRRESRRLEPASGSSVAGAAPGAIAAA